ncbi:hypothetical protein D7X33_18375 [Butyricicoccus sp. 1XD8-22]|nr:hypothetical protein D7X33_18375 [Butyricicoccus sp. 1XD8-22]
MPEHQADIQIGNTLVEAKSDMRDQLVADLRRKTRQSVAGRRERLNLNYGSKGGHIKDSIGRVAEKGIMVEGEPQSVLIENKIAHLAKDVHRLRSRYAIFLSED